MALQHRGEILLIAHHVSHKFDKYRFDSCRYSVRRIHRIHGTHSLVHIRIQRPSQEPRSPTRGPPARQRQHKRMTWARTGVCSTPPICVRTSPPLDSGRSCCCPSVPYRLCAVAGLLEVVGWGRVLYRVSSWEGMEDGKDNGDWRRGRKYGNEFSVYGKR